MSNNQNILVIHPSDSTTDFLSFIYKDINATVICQPISKSRLKKLIKEADRVIMLGHGTEYGMGYVEKGSITKVIDSTFVYLLREKEDNIYIWCHADEFVKKYGLSGFSTGMFISEVAEAEYFNVRATENEVKESNERFARVVRIHVHKKGEDLKNILKNEYVLDSDVARYNHERLYNFRKDETDNNN